MLVADDAPEAELARAPAVLVVMSVVTRQLLEENPCHRHPIEQPDSSVWTDWLLLLSLANRREVQL